MIVAVYTLSDMLYQYQCVYSVCQVFCWDWLMVKRCLIPTFKKPLLTLSSTQYVVRCRG